MSCAGGRWSEWLNNTAERGRKERRAVNDLLDPLVMRHGDGLPPTHPIVVAVGVARAWRIGAHTDQSIAMARWSLQQGWRRRTKGVGVLEHNFLDIGNMVTPVGNLPGHWLHIAPRDVTRAIGALSAPAYGRVTFQARGGPVAEWQGWLDTCWRPAVRGSGCTLWPLDWRLASAVARGEWHRDVTVAMQRRMGSDWFPLLGTPNAALLRSYVTAIASGTEGAVPSASRVANSAALLQLDTGSTPYRGAERGFCKPYTGWAVVSNLRVGGMGRQKEQTPQIVRNSLVIAAVWEAAQDKV